MFTFGGINTVRILRVNKYFNLSTLKIKLIIKVREFVAVYKSISKIND